MDILFLIAQALAIVVIGYVVTQAFVYAAKYGDPITWKSSDFPIPKLPASADTEMENLVVHLSFVPESVAAGEDIPVITSEEPLPIRKAA